MIRRGCLNHHNRQNQDNNNATCASGNFTSSPWSPILKISWLFVVWECQQPTMGGPGRRLRSCKAHHPLLAFHAAFTNHALAHPIRCHPDNPTRRPKAQAASQASPTRSSPCIRSPFDVSCTTTKNLVRFDFQQHNTPVQLHLPVFSESLILFL